MERWREGARGELEPETKRTEVRQTESREKEGEWQGRRGSEERICHTFDEKKIERGRERERAAERERAGERDREKEPATEIVS